MSNYLSMASPVRRWIEILVVVLAVAGLLPAAAPAQGSGFAPITEPQAHPALNLPDMDGKTIDLASLRGRVVVVNFWATWCPPCRREFPSLGRLQKLFKPQDLTVVAVNVGEDADTIFAFAGNPDITVLLDRDSKAMSAWKAKGLPSTFALDREGRVVLRAVGGRELDSPDTLSQLRALTRREAP